MRTSRRLRAPGMMDGPVRRSSRPTTRPREGVARALAATAVVLALVAAACGGPQATPLPSPTPTAPGSLSPLDEALQGIQDDGSYSADTALAVFAAAFGPLPGVPAPRQDHAYHSGTLAIQMVRARWADLTGEQHGAIEKYVGPVDATTAAAPIVTAAFRPPLELATYQSIADTNAGEIAARFGRALGIPIQVVLGDSVDPGGAWAWAKGNWKEVPAGSPATRCTITIPPDTANDRARDPYMHWLLLHEVWHCFEYTMVSGSGLDASPPWVVEGEASFVAESITGGQGAPPPELDHWRHYIEDPGKPLFGRAYDAVGFYAQMAHNNVDPWTRLQPMMQAGGSDAALQASGGAASTFADRWGSSWFRDAQPNPDWAMTDGFGIPSMAYRAAPQAIQITDGGSDSISAKPNAGGVADVHTTAFVTEFAVSGVGRVADPGSAALDEIVRAGKLDLCTSPSGTCACPPNSPNAKPEPRTAPQSLHAAVTGEPRNLSVMDISGISEDDWCGEQPSPTPAGSPCKSGCGGSNGDPHLRTIDGARYDLQAAGEYVLLRSGDGSIEIQARQEPPCTAGGASPPPTFGSTCQATINTAIAVKVNGHRVGFYAAAAVPEVRIDGALVDAGAVGSANLGSGATLTGYRRGYQLDLPDGTRVWALSVGSFGINLLVKPSTQLFAGGVGLLAQVPATAGLRVPAMPDGSAVPAPLDAHDRYRQLYEVFAPAWRVTPQSTLFDYQPGQSASTFAIAGFPPEALPASTKDLDPGLLASARSSCAAVTDADLADECAYDTAVTGNAQFVTVYQATEQLQTVGPSTLALEPGATPAPPTSAPASQRPAIAGGVNLVDDHLANYGSTGAGTHALGPDGTIYVEIARAGASFGDVTTQLLAVDGSTGAVKQRATLDGGGELALAAGSLWVDAFKRPSTGCAVSRLDPATLAVQATVATVCGGNDQTLLVAFDGALWFVDPTGAAADGTGGHLRRIDPSTNAVDRSPSGSIEMPFVSPFLGAPMTSSLLAPTSAGLIAGDGQHGFFRLATGASAFESIGNPGTGYHPYPAGDGLWVQTDIGTQDAPESQAAFFSGGSTAARQLTVQYEVIGADDSSVYTAYAPSDDQADGLWSNPIDGGGPQRIAVSAFEPSTGGGTARLPYQDPLLPLMVGEHALAKLWVVPSPADPTLVALYEQVIPVP